MFGREVGWTESFLVSPFKVTPLTENERCAEGQREILRDRNPAGPEQDFIFVVLKGPEWDVLPELLNLPAEEEKQRFSKERIKRLKRQAAENKKTANENTSADGNAKPGRRGKRERLGPLERARMECLGDDLYYLCYLDIDSKGKEYPMQIFFNAHQVILIEEGSFPVTRLEHWREISHLAKPLDLIRLLGQYVLHSHQDRLEKIEDQMDKLEGEILNRPQRWQQNEIMNMHRMVLRLKKSLNAHQFAFSCLANLDAEKERWAELAEDMRREMENVRLTHELVENLREAYQASLDVRSNEIMKVLTVLATILLPINFLTGFFGMNFANMPLIHSPYGIEIFFLLCAVVVLAAVFILKRKRWLK